MNPEKPLNIFYEEPDPDRWFIYDRYPRRLIRNILRRKPPRPGGVKMVAFELMRGLDKLCISYRFNDYAYIKKHPKEIACIIGKPHVLFKWELSNPILFGAGIFSHPIDCPDLFIKYPNVKKILVPGKWMLDMFRPYYGNQVLSWPVGIDTEKWKPVINDTEITTDFLIYVKILWNYNEQEKAVLNPIIQELKKQNLTYTIIKYGNYTHTDLIDKLKKSKASIFLGEHETQGIAYQQILATDTPILAWDSEGYWKDPTYYPDKVKYSPVSSVPYWDERCGLKFKNIEEFPKRLQDFISSQVEKKFSPRSYIVENLSLEKCAMKYVEIVKDVIKELP